MEEMIANRVTPTIKCMMLFLLIFTAKVLTSRPQENHEDSKNSIHLVSKPAPYVRTFTKYHHRRTQWNSLQETDRDWPSTHDQPKVIVKRNVEIPHLNEFVESSGDIPILNQFASDIVRDDEIGLMDKTPIDKDTGSKNVISGDMKKFKIKAAIVVTDPPKIVGPSIFCLYKIHSVVLSVTPSYDEDSNANVVESEHIDTPGIISETTLPSGERVQVEQCSDARATCYTLHQRDNKTVLGQGCWHSSQSSVNKCIQVLPNTMFCSCNKNYCNAYFQSLPEEIVTPRVIKTIYKAHNEPNYSNIVAAAILALVAILVIGVAFKKLYCTNPETSKEVMDDRLDVEKGEVMGSGPDALATGLSCVDNLTLIEHIGAGRYGSVWRGSLGAMPVAVKLYNNVATWQKEADVYSMPHIKHPNILKYYGSDTRPTLTGSGREHLIVLELCDSTLRQRLQTAPLTWHQFATLARDIASALAHLHKSSGTKPCVVHRDVNSNNVLVRGDRARLADLGLAHPDLRTNIAEAGTARYLSPEALEGALDLSAAVAALCAVDVFALGLVLWEMLWRTSGAHAGPTPHYQLPYFHLGLPAHPTLSTMQNIVSRKKLRPTLPTCVVTEWRVLKFASDTCEECWDQDAEARLTAVCVEERMSELKQMLNNPGPVIHDNNLHPNNPDHPPDQDKNSNCLQQSDQSTPLLYNPHTARNPCLQRNIDTPTESYLAPLIHKSLKDITTPVAVVDAPRVPNLDETCLSMARSSRNRIVVNENSLNEIRSYPRPLDYVPNDVTSTEHREPKQTNLLQAVRIEKPKWGIKRFFQQLNRSPKPMETEVKLVQENLSADSGRIRTSIVGENPSNLPYNRPSNIVLSCDRNIYNTETPCLSPPNRTLSPTMILESDLNRENKVFGFKELPSRNGEETDARPPNQIFAVIVPKSQPGDYKKSTNLIEMRSQTARGSSESLTKNSVRTSMSAQSIFATAGQSESEDSTVKKRLSCDNKIISNSSNSGRSSRASINLELQYIDNRVEPFENYGPYDNNSDCSSSEDEQLMLLSEGSKITMQAIAKTESEKKKPNEVLKEATQGKNDFVFNKLQKKYSNFDNEFSDPHDKENLVTFSGDNPVYLAALNGEIDATEFKIPTESASERSPKLPKPSLKNLAIKRQHSLEQVSELFSSSGDIHLINPAGRVKTPGDIPVAVRRARRDRALQKGRANESNRLSLYDDRMMFGNSL